LLETGNQIRNARFHDVLLGCQSYSASSLASSLRGVRSRAPQGCRFPVFGLIILRRELDRPAREEAAHPVAQQHRWSPRRPVLVAPIERDDGAEERYSREQIKHADGGDPQGPSNGRAGGIQRRQEYME